MKRFLIVIFLLASICVNAQNRGDQHQKPSKEQREKDRARIERLEKIKLIEVLNLSEETIMKFFARRNEFFNTLGAKYFDVMKSTSDNLEADMKSGKKHTDQYYQQLTKKMLALEKEKTKLRESFYLSLQDILTKEQLAKLLVFARRFNEEIMNEAMK
jgi:hypothetical protein